MLSKLLGAVRGFGIVGLLGAATLLSAAVPGPAETSAHRLERKLSKLGKKSGKALGNAGDKLGDALSRVNLDLDIDLDDLIPSGGRSDNKHDHHAASSNGSTSSSHPAADGHLPLRHKP
jgi:hypothetical protein